jgi:NAD(P)-dependent dehydrogenase (short-subunit alcohol dehydrogenase family)
MSSIRSRFDLTGKRALITGAGRGLGRGCALALAEQCAEIIALSRTADEIESLVEEIRSAGGKAQAKVCDVTHSEQIDAILIQQQRIDILVNNAGGNRPMPMTEVDEETLDFMLDLNVRSVYLCSQKVVPLMQQQKSGSIIHMSSQMGHVGAARRTVYCMTKHAIEGLAKAMAVELAAWNIRVNTVAPTFVETPLTRPFFEDPLFKEAVFNHIPMRKLGQIEDIAAAVVYLASDAAAMVTGTSLKVDGGWTAH